MCWRTTVIIMQLILKSLIQSDFRGGDHGNFEAVVCATSSGDPLQLWHWFRDNSDPNLPWKLGQQITDRAAAAGSIIQSDFGSGGHGNFEVVVPLFAPDGSMELWDFFHDNSDVTKPWQQAQRIVPNVAGAGCIIQSDFRSGSHGNFEVVVPVGGSLVHYWHDNSDVSKPWQRGQNITDVARGWGCILRSDYVSNGHGNFEVLVPEASNSLIHYWHPNQDVNLPWLRGFPQDVVIGEPYPALVTGAQKVAQLTGEYDREGWNGQGSPPFAFNRTESRFGIRGTDLGSSFEHDDRLYFLFGDTWRVNQTETERDLDAVAYTTDTDSTQGVHLTFNSKWPFVPGIDQHGFNVPMEGTSWNGDMYVFFTTNHYIVDDVVNLMGRSVLGRSTDGGYTFTNLGELSRRKFINVSV
jgi:Domain of unknown function (DUF4185)